MHGAKVAQKIRTAKRFGDLFEKNRPVRLKKFLMIIRICPQLTLKASVRRSYRPTAIER